MGKQTEKLPEHTVASIGLLDLQCKQTLVDLLADVMCGNVSHRRAATEILKQIPKRRLTPELRCAVRQMRKDGVRVKHIAQEFKIDPSTVWRICKSNKRLTT